METFNPERTTEEPGALRGFARPIVGYVGSIDRRVDLDLVESVAQAFPRASVVLVGPIHKRLDVSRLRRLANVRLIGWQPKSAVPAFIQRMDVCLIPYHCSSFAEAILPLKLFEYLAMRKPVVATALHELKAYETMIAVAHTREAFLDAVREALQRPSALARGMAPASWDARIETVSLILNRLLSRGETVGVSASERPERGGPSAATMGEA